MDRKAETCDEYFQAMGDDARAILNDLFGRAASILDGHAPTMRYGFPLLDGMGKFGIAVRAGYVALYFHHAGLAAAVARRGAAMGAFKLERESLKYKKASDIPVPEILELIAELFSAP